MIGVRYHLLAPGIVLRYPRRSTETIDSVAVHLGRIVIVVQPTLDAAVGQQTDQTTSHVRVINLNRHRRRLVASHCTADAIFDRKLWTGRSVGDHHPALLCHRRIVYAHLLGDQPAARRHRYFCTRRARPSLHARSVIYGRDSLSGRGSQQISPCENLMHLQLQF